MKVIESTGLILFFAVGSGVLLTQNNTIIRLFNADNLTSEKPLRKIESDISLGLNRSLSIQAELCELGQFCSAGQWIVLGLRVCTISSLIGGAFMLHKRL